MKGTFSSPFVKTLEMIQLVSCLPQMQEKPHHHEINEWSNKQQVCPKEDLCTELQGTSD